MKIEEIHITGDCLEAVGIPDGGYALVDRDAKPCVFDIVWCNNELCSVRGYLKQIVQTGPNAIVRTRYRDKSKDYLFSVKEMYGVVLQVMDENRKVVWKRPKIAEYERLQKAILVLSSKYEQALKNDYVHSPLAWALYHTWKEFDRR